MSRRYEMKERARRQEETRARIVDATVALHREVGPARTTVAEIARRAGVSRLTVYNHFPDDRALFGACAAQFTQASPPPDPASWAAIADPDARLRTALSEQFAYFRANEAMLANVTRDAAVLPDLAEIVMGEEAIEEERAMRDALLAGRGLRGARRRAVAAAIGLALAFPTWQHLVRVEELDDETAAALLAGAVAAAGVSRSGRRG
jgi:AcrR family transcriptional regulator